MKKIPQLINPKIYLPCSPSKWISKPEYKKITRINLTSGGGMGGSKWTEYVEQIKELQPNTIQAFTRINGKQILLNTNYITDAEDFRLITVKFHNENPHCYHLGDNTLHYIAEEDIIGIELIDNYGDTPTL